MSNSQIAYSHHYYVIFFRYPRGKDLNSIATDLFGSKFKIVNDMPDGNLHLQIPYSELYGRISKLGANSTQRGTKTLYFYDYYLGKINLPGTSVIYLCYPYRQMAFYLNDYVFSKKIEGEEFFKVDLLKALIYLEKRGETGFSSIEKNGLSVSVTKYTAEVKEDANASAVSLQGLNPLNSKIYFHLRDSGLFKTSASALKLNFTAGQSENLETLDIAFDRLGGYRFWLKQKSQATTIPMLKYVFEFLNGIDALNHRDRINLYTYFNE